MAKPFHGKGSLCYLDSVLFVIKDWSLDLNAITEEGTKVSSNWKKYKVTKMQWNVVCNGFFNNVQDDSIIYGVEYEIKLKLNDTSYLIGDVILSDKQISSDNEGLISYDITFEGTGVLSLDLPS